MHQEFGSNIEADQRTDTTDESKQNQEDLIKFKTQLGVINKHKVTILLAVDLKESDLLDVNQFRKVKKIENKLLCNLIIAVFDDSEEKQKMEKFLRLTEITPVENNFPLKMQVAPECMQQLMIANDFVFGNFATQVKDTILQLQSAQQDKIFDE